MTDIAFSPYLYMAMVTQILEHQVARDNDSTFRIVQNEFNFIEDYVDFLVESDMARVGI